MALNDMTAYLWALYALGDPYSEMYYGSSPTPEMMAYANALAGRGALSREVYDQMLDLLRNPETIKPEEESLMRTRAFDVLNQGREEGLRQLNERAAATGAGAGAGGFMQMYNQMFLQNAMQRAQAGTDIRLNVADANRNARSAALALVGDWQNQRDMARAQLGGDYAARLMDRKTQSGLLSQRNRQNRTMQILGAVLGGLGTAGNIMSGFGALNQNPANQSPYVRTPSGMVDTRIQ